MKKLAEKDRRDRSKPLRTLVNADERKVIEVNARNAGLTVSAYLRAASLGSRTDSKLDLQAVATLAKINADQARLGNLMKLYLQDAKPDHAAATRLIGEIRGLQGELKDIVKRVQM